MALEDRREKAQRYVMGIAAGAIPPELIGDEFFAWTAFSGKVEREEYLRRVGLIGHVFVDGGLRFTLDRTTAENDSVAVQVRGEGVLFNGKPYTQSYIFIIEFDDSEKVRHIREYIDTHIVHEVLYPAMVEWTRDHAPAQVGG
jgi:ketosteroid isomerase-like protein